MESYKNRVRKTKYSVSTYGNVRNNKTKKLIGQHLQNNGYYGFTISHKGKLYSFKTASLVAKTFIKNNDPNTKTQVDHINGTPDGKRNNSIFNLEWVTPAENQQRAITNNLHRSGSVIITESDKVYEIYKMLQNNESVTKISNELDVSKRVIYSILNKKAFTKISNNFDFSGYTKHTSGSKPSYSDETVHKICKLYLTNMKIADIANIVNIPENTIYGVISGKYKAYLHITNQYDFSKRIKPKKSSKKIL